LLVTRDSETTLDTMMKSIWKRKFMSCYTDLQA